MGRTEPSSQRTAEPAGRNRQGGIARSCYGSRIRRHGNREHRPRVRAAGEEQHAWPDEGSLSESRTTVRHVSRGRHRDAATQRRVSQQLREFAVARPSSVPVTGRGQTSSRGILARAAEHEYIRSHPGGQKWVSTTARRAGYDVAFTTTRTRPFRRRQGTRTVSVPGHGPRLPVSWSRRCFNGPMRRSKFFHSIPCSPSTAVTPGPADKWRPPPPSPPPPLPPLARVRSSCPGRGARRC